MNVEIQLNGGEPAGCTVGDLESGDYAVVTEPGSYEGKILHVGHAGFCDPMRARILDHPTSDAFTLAGPGRGPRVRKLQPGESFTVTIK